MNHSGTIKPEEILDAVSSFYNTSLFEKTNKRDKVFPRQVAIYMFMVFTNFPVTKIAEIWDMDHSTVTYANKQIRGLCLHHSEIRKQIIEIESQLE